MKITFEKLTDIIVQNNGLTDGLNIEMLKLYFLNNNIDELNIYGKIKKNKFYPCFEIWQKAVNTIIENNILAKSIYLKSTDNISIDFLDNATNIEFDSYLSKKQLKKIIKNKNLFVNKKKNKIIVSFIDLTVDYSFLKDKYDYLFSYISAFSFRCNDSLEYLKIKNQKIAKVFTDYKLIKKYKRNIYKITDETLKRIFLERLNDKYSSYRNKNTEQLANEQKIYLINTTISDEEIKKLIPYISTKFNILKREHKYDEVNNKYSQLVMKEKD